MSKKNINLMIIIYALIFLLLISSCATSDITELADLSQMSQQPQSENTEQAVTAVASESIDNSLNDDNNIENEENEIINDSPPLSLEEDVGISISGQWFPILQDASALLDALGRNYDLSTAPSCVFEGEDKEFDYGDLLISTNPNQDGTRDIWYSIYITGGDFPTSRGIKVGSTIDEVVEVYGSRYFWESDSIKTFSISGVQGDITSPCIQFTIIDGLVTAIEIYYPTNV